MIHDIVNHLVLTLSKLFKLEHLLNQLSQPLFTWFFDSWNFDGFLFFAFAFALWVDVDFDEKWAWKGVSVNVIDFAVLYLELFAYTVLRF